MAKIAALFLAIVTGARLPPPDPRPPPPAPPSSPRPPAPIEITCILDDRAPLPMCGDTFPGLPFGLSFLKPCPDWLGRIVAEAERL